MQPCKFGQNQPIGSGDVVLQTGYADADANGIRTKQCPPPLAGADIIT